MKFGMNRGLFSALIAATALAMPAAAAAAAPLVISDVVPQPVRRRAAPVRSAPVKYRSRWKAARPKRRRNLVTHSRRVRRRHRRAAK